MHRLLNRQIKKLFGEQTPSKGDLQPLIQIVNESYFQFQDDYNKLERILELSSKESFKELSNFKAAIDTAALVSLTDHKADILMANENFCKISGYSLGELIGKNHNIVNSGYHSKGFFSKLWKQIGSGQIWQGEICNRTKNGELYWVDSTIIPFLNEKGIPYQYLSIRFDITARKRIEKEIKTLALVAQKTQNLVIISDPNGLATWANEGFERVTGYTVKELIGKKPGKLLQGPESDVETIKSIRHALDNKVPITTEIVNFTKSGKPYWISLSINPINEDGRHIGFIAIESDITERKKYELKLKENDVLLRAINSVSAELLANSNFEDAVGKAAHLIGKAFKVNQVNIIKNNKDIHGQVVSYSQKFQWSKDSNSIILNNPEIQEINYSKAGLERWKEELSNNKIIQSQIADLPESEQSRFTLFNVKSVIASPIFINDEFWGFLGLEHTADENEWDTNHEQILRNVAGNIGSAFERNYTEIKLKENEEKFRLLIESATDIFYYTDSTGNFVYVNDIATKITGFSTEELLKMNYLDLVAPEQRNKVGSFYKKQSLLGNKVTYNEFQITTKSGQIVWIGQNVQLIDSDNNQKAIQAIARDITLVKNAQIEIENSHKFLNEIIDSIPNPLFVKNRTHEWIMVNNAYTKLTRIEKNKILGNDDTKFLEDSSAKDFIKEDEQQFIDQKDRLREVVFIDRDENEKILLVKKSIYKNLNNHFLISVITDITERKKSEERVKDLKEFYENVLNKIPSDVVVFDKNHKYLFVNEMAVKDPSKRAWMVGHDDYEYVEKYQKNISIAHERRRLFEIVKTQKKQLEFEEKLNALNGKSNWILRRYYPVLDKDGEILNVIGFGLDITIRKEAEEKIKQNEERLKLATSSANLGIWDWDLVSKNLIWDKSMYEIFHVNPKQFTNDYDAFEKTLHPDDKVKVNEEIQYALANNLDYKSIFRIVSDTKEIKYINAVSKTFRDSVTNIPQRMIGVNFDVTEATLIQQKILKQQSDLEEAQHIAKVGAWEIDVKERQIVWSKEMFIICEMDGSVQPTLNQTYNLFTIETRDQMIQAFFNAIENLEEFEVEAKIVTFNGNNLYIRTKGIPYLLNGKVISIRGIFQDITLEKEAKRIAEQYTIELEKKNKELDQFAYVVSHNLKAPLRGINNLSMWIEEDLEGKIETDTKNNLDLMRKRVKRMEGLIDGILQYSRAGRIKHESISFSLNETLNELIANMSPPDKFKITIQENLPKLKTEKIAIEQVFSNYISNAIKYNNNLEPTIAISYKEKNGLFEFCVADNGPGIEKEFFDKVFVIFQTLQSRDSFESTGVGLAIVKKMVEDKGGSVWIESEIGKGSKFYFSWPIIEEIE
jgi:PAS domain S-box-containing protein